MADPPVGVPEDPELGEQRPIYSHSKTCYYGTTTSGTSAREPVLRRALSEPSLWTAEATWDVSTALSAVRGVEHSANSFVSALSTHISQPPEDTFFCQICADSVLLSASAVLQKCGCEDHRCCHDCLRRHLSTRIDDGRVDEAALSCIWGTCGAAATEEELRQFLEAPQFEKYLRFKQQRSDPDLRECPNCRRQCRPSKTGSGVVAEMVCASCSLEFCFYHSNAHEPGKAACEEYERTQIGSQAKAWRNTKFCPRCTAPTEKVEGCNHMTCGQCKCNWCWSCGWEIGNIGWHYSPANLFGCHQFQKESGRDCVGVIFKLLGLPMAFLCILLSLISLVLMIVLSPLLVGCCCGVSQAKRNPCLLLGTLLGGSVWAAVTIALPCIIFLALYLVHGLFTMVVALFFRSIASADQMAALLGVPFTAVLTTIVFIASCFRMSVPQNT